jgi:hypothetical protein
MGQPQLGGTEKRRVGQPPVLDIGMGVHTEAVVIADLNGTGKLKIPKPQLERATTLEVSLR